MYFVLSEWLFNNNNNNNNKIAHHKINITQCIKAAPVLQYFYGEIINISLKIIAKHCKQITIT